MSKITGIHQIEITSECNLRCRYCVHPKMARPKQHMDKETWQQTLRWLEHFVRRGTQGRELNLCGIGESTLHPDFASMVLTARFVIGPQRDLILATNGVGLTREHAEAMRAARMKVWVSLHRPEKAKEAVDMLRERGVLCGISIDPSVAAVDWAGQVEWQVTAPAPDDGCMWLKQRLAFVMSDGRVGSCCFDGEGKDGILGTVNDNMAEFEHGQYSLCSSCHMLGNVSVKQEAVA